VFFIPLGPQFLNFSSFEILALAFEPLCAQRRAPTAYFSLSFNLPARALQWQAGLRKSALALLNALFFHI